MADTIDAEFMRRAISIAREAKSQPGCTAVGALVVLNGRMIASACNEVELRGDPTAHAEILAIQRACEAISNVQLREARAATGRIHLVWSVEAAVGALSVELVCREIGGPLVTRSDNKPGFGSRLLRRALGDAGSTTLVIRSDGAERETPTAVGARAVNV